MNTAEYKNSFTTPLQNSKAYMMYVSTLSHGNMHILHRDNRKVMAQRFGKAQFHFRSEFDFHCWLIHFGHNDYVVLTAGRKGTCIEIVKKVPTFSLSDNPEFIQFSDWLIEKLKGSDRKG